MKIVHYHPVVIPYFIVVTQIPAINGYFNSVEGWDGITYHGFPGYAVGFLYGMIGVATAFVLMFGFQYATNKIGKQNG